MAKKKILVVDDEPDMLKIIGTRLRSSGYTVITAVNEEECMKRAAADAPDLILLDVLLPGMGGFGVCKLLKEDPKTREIPVIMVTALLGGTATKKALESGAEYLITKPFDPSDLLWEIEDALKKNG
jgi:CheY-like chemotaxis protein